MRKPRKPSFEDFQEFLRNLAEKQQRTEEREEREREQKLAELADVADGNMDIIRSMFEKYEESFSREFYERNMSNLPYWAATKNSSVAFAWASSPWKTMSLRNSRVRRRPLG